MGEPNRSEGLDALRGFAVVLMILFHLSYDLSTPSFSLRIFHPSPSDWPKGYWVYFSDLIGVIFFSVVGLSVWMKQQSAVKAGDKTQSRSFFYRRGLRILAIAFALTLGTIFFQPSDVIYFGVLHCIGVSVLLLPFFFRLSRPVIFMLSLFMIVAGLVLRDRLFSFSWLFWLGFQPTAWLSGDWYPLLPWFGVALLGFYLGPIFLHNQQRSSQRNQQRSSFAAPRRFSVFLGQHSLMIYLIHQPVLWGVLTLLKKAGY